MVYSSSCVTKAKMKHGYLFGLIFVWNTYVNLGQRIEILNNCTCKTSDGGIYNLMPLGKGPKLKDQSEKYPGWWYVYHPCTPFDLGQDDPHADRNRLCRDVAICKYAETEEPREYFEVGLQRDISCEIGKGGEIELVYKTNDSSIDNPKSKVQFHCDESTADPLFKVEDDDNYIFSIKHYCACRDRCPLQPGSSTPPQPGSSGRTTPSSEPETTSPRPGTPSSHSRTGLDWKMEILLPSLLVAFVVVICLVCFWMQLSVIQRARLCRCCHCYEQNRDPIREERNVFVNEKSALIDHKSDRAVEHEYSGGKGKLNEPVQEEDGDVKGESEFPGKDDSTVAA